MKAPSARTPVAILRQGDGSALVCLARTQGRDQWRADRQNELDHCPTYRDAVVLCSVWGYRVVLEVQDAVAR